MTSSSPSAAWIRAPGPPDQWTSFYNPWIEVVGNNTDPPGTGPTDQPPPPPPATLTTEQPLPTWTEWPPGVIEPAEEDDDDDDDDGAFIIVPCSSLWFFNFCIDFPEIAVLGWRIRVPPGIIGPGPPPPGFVNLNNWKIVPGFTMPPWPRVTRPPRPGVLEYPEKPSDCVTETHEVAFQTVSAMTTVSNGQTRTTSVTTITRTATVLGCEAPEGETTTTETCGPPNMRSAATPTPILAGFNETKEGDEVIGAVSQRRSSQIKSRQLNPFDQNDPANWVNDNVAQQGCGEPLKPWIIYPAGHRAVDVAIIKARLQAMEGKQGLEYREVRSDALDRKSVV